MSMNFEDTVNHLTKSWAGRTLEDFRKETQKEATGMLFESLQVEGAQRLMIIVCVTGMDWMAVLEKIMDLGESVPSADWNSLTLGDMAMRTANGEGLSYEDLRDDKGKRIALALCATKPDSIKTIETIFALPN